MHQPTDNFQIRVSPRWADARAAARFRQLRKTGGVDVFDQIIVGALPAEVVWRSDRVIAFLDARPLFPGHTLVCPVEHHEALYDLPQDLYTDILAVARRVALAQRQVLGAEGTFLGNNNVISQSVPHFHLHVVPRRKGDGLRGFFWPRTRPTADELRAVADQLRAALTEEHP